MPVNHAAATPAGTGAPSDRSPVPAASLPDGTRHPDPRLAAKGWQVQRGIYVRKPERAKGRKR